MSWKLFLTIFIAFCVLNKYTLADDLLDDAEETASVLGFKRPFRFFKLAAGDWSKQWGAFKVLEGIKALKKGKELTLEALFPVLSDWKFLGTENVYVISDPQTGEISLMTPEELENSRVPILIPDVIPTDRFHIRPACDKRDTIPGQIFQIPNRNMNRNDIYENQYQETKMMPVAAPNNDGMELIYSSQPEAINKDQIWHQYGVDNSGSYVSQIEAKSTISELGQLGSTNIFAERPQNVEQTYLIEKSEIDELSKTSEMDSTRDFLKRSPDMFQNYEAINAYQGLNDFVAAAGYQGAEEIPQIPMPEMIQHYRAMDDKNPIPSQKPQMYQGYRAMEDLPAPQKQPQSYQGVSDFVAFEGYRAANEDAQKPQMYQGYRAMEEASRSEKRPQAFQGLSEFVAFEGYRAANEDAQKPQMYQGYRAMEEAPRPEKQPQAFQGLSEFDAYQGYREANEDAPKPQMFQGYRAMDDSKTEQKQPQPFQGVSDFVATQGFQIEKEGSKQYQNIQAANDFVAAPIQTYQGFQANDEASQSQIPQAYQGYRAEIGPMNQPQKDTDDKEIVGTFGAKHHKGKGGSSVHHHHHYDNDYGHGSYGHGGYGHGSYGHGGYGHGGYGHGGYGGHKHGGYGHGGYGHGGYGHGKHGHGRDYRSPVEAGAPEEESIKYQHKSSLIDSPLITETKFDENLRNGDLESSASEQNSFISDTRPLFSFLNPFSLLTRALRQCPCEQLQQQSNVNQDYSQFNYQPYSNENFLGIPSFNYYPPMMPFSRPVYAESSQYSPIVGASLHNNYHHDANINSTTNKTNSQDPSVGFPVPTALRTPFLGFFGNSPTPEYAHQHHNTAYFDPYAHVNYGHHHHHHRRDASYPFLDFSNRPTRNIDSNQINKISTMNDYDVFNNDNSRAFKLRNLFQLPKTQDNFNAFDLWQLPKFEDIWQSGLRPKAEAQNPQRKIAQNPFVRRRPTVHVIAPNYIYEQPKQEYNQNESRTESKIEKKDEKDLNVSEVYPIQQTNPDIREKTVYYPKPVELNREKLNQPLRRLDIKSYVV